MEFPTLWLAASPLIPVVLMGLAALWPRMAPASPAALWRSFQAFSLSALLIAIANLGFSVAGGSGSQPITTPGAGLADWPAFLLATPLGLSLAVLVQLLGTVIGAFSARYLQGEAGQARYLAALAAVLAAVQVLLLADHWVVLIAAWALVGVALQRLLCFYPERPFAQLAALKKRMADRAADALLIAAAALAWAEVGSGSLSALSTHLALHGLSLPLQVSAVALSLAVILRTALLPVHGWLIQVMEAPTPVSALLHAGVVNLGGFVLIRFAPLLEQALPARALLLAFGLGTAILAGMVMLTRISIKVRLAWSTVAQMGFMLLECALGLYTLAALHLIGHSLYKAHAFLGASTVVRQTRLQALHSTAPAAALSLALAPLLAGSVLLLAQSLPGQTAWPSWWSAVLALAWAPLLWQPSGRLGLVTRAQQTLWGLLMVLGLSAATLLAHALPLGLQDSPHPNLGLLALAGMAALYACLALLQRRPQALSRWRQWSYAGFYVDEAYTRLALRLSPRGWTPAAHKGAAPQATPRPLADAQV